MTDQTNAALNLLRADGDPQAEAMTDQELKAAVVKEKEQEDRKKADALFAKLIVILDTRDLNGHDFPEHFALAQSHYRKLCRKAFDKGYLMTAGTFSRGLGFVHRGGTLRVALKAWLNKQ